MDQSMGGNNPVGNNTNPGSTTNLSNFGAPDEVHGLTQTAHQAVDKVADRATSQVERLSGAAHQVVNSAANAATSASQWSSTLPEEVAQTQTRITEAACNSIRARPVATVVGAAVIGYLLGRLTRA